MSENDSRETIPADETEEEIGSVFVDAGMIWVGDPCYIMGTDAIHRVDDWQKFVDEIFGPLGMAPLGPGTGLAIPSGYGDGEYPVYAKYRDGRVAEVRIVFIGPEDLDEDSDSV